MQLYVKIKKTLLNFTLDIEFETNNENISLLGASGSGKSMTLKCIAGIEKPDEGLIVLNNNVLFDSKNKIDIPPQKRNIGYLFQNYALFPSMTVFKNIFISIKNKNKYEATNEAISILKNFNLYEIRNEFPSKISGGEKQRVALARIIVNNPQIMLLDEPFSSVDSYLRYYLIKNLQNVIKRYNKNIILVSHNKDDSLELCSKIAIINKGNIIDYGNINTILNETKNEYSKILLGLKGLE